ncbi:Zn(II)2Cys6 transcription factor domain-containing protein [Aspergillus mulundensis]|uniref:Zn(2)-C6 fungal-type domain-containing protein n=1 Tax=Aspergillus mulundensis TaxID=1810919 RepID=A0A3D8RL20_9EURO|nr:hypothetical protein DSM5745_07312 [Aspergillus mulundensis]RDW74650.1 hypothetical protein DSM5745_07312 [Aspergillus mulundensis]
MVFPGRRSIGCYTCRQRKVKCDAKRPACDRCTKFGRTCPGYPDTFAFKAYDGSSHRIASTSRWVDQPPSTVGSPASHEREGSHVADAPISAPAPVPASSAAPVPVSDHSPDVYISHLDSISSPSSPLTFVSMNIPQSISTSHSDDVPLSFFMHTHVLIVDKSPCGGHLAFLPEFYREKSSEPCLRHSVLSLGCLALFNYHRSKDLWIKARKHYSAALAALAAAIDTKESAIRDEVFASALFLGIFTDLNGERRTNLNDHIPGVYALIQARGSACLTGKYGRRLLAWAFNQLQIQAIANNEHGYAHLPSLFEDLQRPDSVCQAIKLVSLISGFCQSTTDATREQFTHQLCSYTTSQDVEYVFDEIANWETRLPGHWKRQLEHMRYDSAWNQEPSGQNIWTACFMALINSSILLFYIQCLDYLPALFLADYEYEAEELDPPLLHHDIFQRICGTLNVICSAVRYTIGDLDAYGIFRPFHDLNHGITYNLIWPMSLVSQCRFASPEQALLCSEALHYTQWTTGRS